MLLSPFIYGATLMAIGAGGFALAWSSGGWQDPAVFSSLVPAGFGLLAVVLGLLARVMMLQRAMLILTGVLALMALGGTLEGAMSWLGWTSGQGSAPMGDMEASRALGEARSMALMAFASLVQVALTVHWVYRKAPVVETGLRTIRHWRRMVVGVLVLWIGAYGSVQQRSSDFAAKDLSRVPMLHVVMLAHSDDGRDWTLDPEPILAPGGAPGLVQLGNSTLLYAVSGATGDLVVTNITNSPDIDAPLLIEPETTCARDRGKACLDPAGIVLEDGQIRLYFVVADRHGDPSVPGETLVLSALSQDGLQFEVEPGVRWSGTARLEPDPVALPDGRTRLYTSRKASADSWVIESAISSDGLNFEEEGMRRPDGRSISTQYSPDGFVHVVHAADGGLGLVRSSDGLILDGKPESVVDVTRFDGTRFMGVSAPSLVRKSDGTWLMAMSVLREPWWPLNALVPHRVESQEFSALR